MRPLRSLSAALVLLAVVASGAPAQVVFTSDSARAVADSIRLKRFLDRWSGTLGLGIMQPVGEFKDNVNNGVGFDGEAALRLDRRGILSLRAMMNFVGYGHEVKRSMISPWIGGRILVDVVTDNQIFSLGVGPRLAVPSGPVRPYVAGSVGFANFSTNSHIDDNDSNTDGSDNAFSTEQLSDTRLAWTGSGGILIPVHWDRHTAMQLDFGATYHGGDKAKYLRPGDITDNPDGSISFTPRYTATRFIVYRVGLRFGF